MGLPGGPVGTAKSDRRARSDSARPFKRGPGARLTSGLQGQGNDGVGGQARTHFLAYATAPQGLLGLTGKYLRK